LVLPSGPPHTVHGAHPDTRHMPPVSDNPRCVDAPGHLSRTFSRGRKGWRGKRRRRESEGYIRS